MKLTNKTIRNSFLGIAAILLIGSMLPGAFTEKIVVNEFIVDLKNKLKNYNNQFPDDKVYLQFDKTLYKPGETIWFSGYVRNGSDLKASKKSEILHVDLIDTKGNVSKRIKLIARNGVTKGDFALDQYAAGGLYKVKAYTNWQKNFGEDTYFEKELQVQAVVLPTLLMKMEFMRKAYGPGDNVIAKINLNTIQNQPLSDYQFSYVANLDGNKLLKKLQSTDATGEAHVKFQLPDDLETNDGILNVMIDYEGKTESISRSIPITLGNIDLSFYPEGGDLVEGLESQVAFKALNEFGKPADIEGEVYDKHGRKVSSFKSFHNGMGSFGLVNKIGGEYTARITNPKGVDKAYTLPEALPRGWVMSVQNSKDKLNVVVNSTENEEMSLVCQVGGKEYYSRAISVTRGSNDLAIPTDHFPMGVAHITLFDARNIERAERLVFVNKDRQMKIEIKTNKEKYLPREKVTMTLRVSDERGLPIPANLSMAVVDDKLLTFADDKSGNILSELLLESDIRTKVEEPKFYFDPKEEKANAALDYLLMTDGWRRFTWEKVIAEDYSGIEYQGERAIVAGVVLDNNRKPISGASIRINGTGKQYFSDSKGKFVIRKLDLNNQVYLNFTSNSYNVRNQYIQNYNENLTVYMSPVSNYSTGYNYRGGKGGIRNKANVPRMARAGGGVGAMPEMKMQMDVPVEMAFAEDIEGFAMQEPAALVREKAANEQQPLRELAKRGEDDKDMDRFDMEEVLAGEVDGLFWDQAAGKKKVAQPQNAVYYNRAREFPAVNYSNNQTPEIRNDFRSTVFWNGNINVGRSGRTTVEFYNSDDVTSFRATVEGIGVGLVGRTEKKYFTQLPFSMYAKVPTNVVTQDIVSIPLTLKNNTDQQVVGDLTVQVPKGFKVLNNVATTQKIAPRSTRTIYMEYEVLDKPGEDIMNIYFASNGLKDAFSQKVKIGSKGFPVSLAFSGQEIENDYTIDISHPVKGSLTASLTAYPSVVNDLMSGIESIIREPSGCFEQTSMSNYPNIMAMQYIQETNSGDDNLLASIEPKLDRGYKKLVSYETSKKGYEWFGSAPGHEALTAYGLMQFNDMKDVYSDVDDKMVARTANWLMSRRDGKGGFSRNPKALDRFGRASPEVATAYIVYALSEAGYKDIRKELDQAYKNANKSQDAYQMALVIGALQNFNDPRASSMLNKLILKQNKDGSWDADHSITRSGGKSLQVETTALSVVSILNAPKKDQGALNKGIKFLVGSRSGYGAFGSTQGTILALKALTEFARFSKRTDESGTIQVYINGKMVKSQRYEAGHKGTIVMDGLEKHLKDGKQKIKVRYVGVKDPLPYSVSIDYHTSLPPSAKECNVDIRTELAAKECKVGETVRLSTTLTNVKQEGQPMTMAVVGIPSGLSAQPWQLKELQEKGIVDFYEVRDNYVIFYYRDMAPGQVHEVNLDLKAEVPGKFDSPASSGYLYYTNEYKCWTTAGTITIKK